MTSINASIERWFDARGWQPQAFQRQAWAAYADGASGLIHAPTGTGKTLAALFGPAAQAMAQPPPAAAPPITLLWVTPLRALAADTETSLAAPLADLDLPWTVERRTGDTGSSARARQRTRLPTVLITTPESLSLLLSYADTRRQLRGLACVVVDEWHELLGSKRGVQLELCLAHLRRLAPGLRTWGLSATLGNLDQALAALLGPAHPDGRLIAGQSPKTVSIETLLPDTLERFPWAGSLGLRLLPQLVDRLPEHGTTLLFTNTRAQAELWHHGLQLIRPDWERQDLLALHHSAIDRRRRQTIEQRLKDGALRCAVCTSSLDLGVDFAPVDRVVQIGSPKGVARLAQRAGRSGHRPGEPSCILCVPTHALELVEIAAARQALAAGRVEARPPLRLSLDVLIQHLITLALGGGFVADETLTEVRASYAFQNLSEADWRWALDFISRGGDALRHYPQYQKAVLDDDCYRVDDRRIGRLHRLSIGTIESNSLMQVKFVKGGSLGQVEERFIARLQPGERFLFAGKLLTLSRVRDMTAYVRLAKNANGGSGKTPRWTGNRLPFSELLAEQVLALLQAPQATPELAKIAPLLALQQRWSALPAAAYLLIEQVRSREGQHWFCYPFAGRAAHEGLAALVAYRLSRQRPLTFSISVNDYGFELLSAGPLTLTEQDWRTALALAGGREALIDDLGAALNLAELARRQFRDIARIAGLVFSGYPGAGKTGRQLQASSTLIYDVLRDFDPDNKLLVQAEREALAQLSSERLAALLGQFERRPLRLETPPRLTPLAFPLWAERLQFQLSSESWKDRVERMVQALENTAATVTAPKRRPTPC